MNESTDINRCTIAGCYEITDGKYCHSHSAYCEVNKPIVKKPTPLLEIANTDSNKVFAVYVRNSTKISINSIVNGELISNQVSVNLPKYMLKDGYQLYVNELGTILAFTNNCHGAGPISIVIYKVISDLVLNPISIVGNVSGIRFSKTDRVVMIDKKSGESTLYQIDLEGSKKLSPILLDIFDTGAYTT